MKARTANVASILVSVTIVAVSAALASSSAAAPDANQPQAPQRFQWPSFRGPAASGVADGQDPPATWDATTGRNVLWKTPVPGMGHSSPIVWGDRIFLTTAISDDPDSVFRYGTDGRQDRRSDRSRHVWQVYAIDRLSGEVAWVREPIIGAPSVQRHPKNSYASATPATDGEHVVVMVATGGLSCYDFDGELLWDVELGPLDAGASYDGAYQWGAASSPIIWEGIVIVQADQQEGSFIAAFDVDTGEEIWRTPRDLISSFSTPAIHIGADRVELVTNGAGTMHGYDPRSGEELWRMSGSSLNTTPTPISDSGLIFVTSGYRTRPIFAIRPGATGDISLPDGQSSNEHVAWSSPRDGPYIASPLAYRGYLYVVSANGVLTVFDAMTGERAYKRRIGDTGGAYSASPVAADGRIYLTSEDGDIFVLRSGPDYELLAMNRMDEVCLATPAISEGQMFIRTTGHLYALEAGIAATAAAPVETPLLPFPASFAADAELLFDDFEDGDLIAQTGVRWQTFTNGVSTADLALVDGGAAATANAARVTGELAAGAARGPLAQMYLPFDRGAVTTNLESLGGVRLYARGSGSFDLSFNCRNGGSGARLDVSDDWRMIEVEASRLTLTFGQPQTAEWSGAECIGLYLSTRSAANIGDFWLEVDEIVFYGTDAWALRAPRPTPQLPRSELFTFHSDSFLNLHHFLYRWAQAGPGADTSGLGRRIRLHDADQEAYAPLSAADRDVWDRAVAYYRFIMIDRDLLFDGEMVALRDCLFLAGNFCDRIAERDQNTLDVLNETMPVYRRHWWERHTNENQAWINTHIPMARAHEAQIAPRMAAAYTGMWSEQRNRVDVMLYANRVGGYTTSDGHITVSSVDAGTQGYLGLELLFHEASHGDTMELPLHRLIRNAFGAIDAETPPDLWHMTIFYTSGAVTRSVLAEAGIEYAQTYAEFAGIFDRRPANIRAKAALDAAWQEALDAQAGYAQAMRAVAAAWESAGR